MVGREAIIGYSFWGFLGPGIIDTPDGGRSHRRPLVDAIAARGHRLVFLQAHRDLLEAGDDLGGVYTAPPPTPTPPGKRRRARWPGR
jgi:hypothetical protein